MTCIAGMVKENTVYIGADSKSASRVQATSRKDQKVFEVDDFIIGCTTSYRMIQLLKYKLDVPEQSKKQSDHEYMVTDFIDSIRELFEKNGFLKERSNGQEEGGRFLVGYKGELYKIDYDYQVAMLDNGISAVGSGGLVALGSLYSLMKNTDKEPEKIVREALLTAKEYVPTVGGPISILSKKHNPEQEKMNDFIKYAQDLSEKQLKEAKGFIEQVT